MNTFGQIFRLTSFGESHGKAIGGIIDGCPAGLNIDFDFIQKELNRRKPGQSKITTQRTETDIIEFISGIFEGKTQGTPIAFIVFNQNQKTDDYNDIKNIFRPSHADYTYTHKYGSRDHRGGGRSSARETISRVVAGSVAKLFLNQKGININAFVKSVGNIELKKHYSELDLSKIESNIIRCPDTQTAKEMIALVEQVKNNKDTIGGVIQAVITGVPVGLGEPVFNKLQANLAAAMLGINAVKGFEYGSGFEGTKLTGSEHNDIFENIENRIKTITNKSGGIQGGISNGEDIYFNVAFKPVATFSREQKTIDKDYNNVIIKPKGRHDPCVLPRAVPIVEAMAALVIADNLLLNRVNIL